MKRITKAIKNRVNLYMYANKIRKRLSIKNNLNIKETDGCYVLIHLGDVSIPDYTVDAVKQIRLFNRCHPIVLVSTKKAFDGIKSKIEKDVEFIDLNLLPVSQKHFDYIMASKMFDFSLYTTERFFVLEEVIAALGLTNVVHLENDILVYDDLIKYYMAIITGSDKLVITRHSDCMCIGGVVFVPTLEAIRAYTDYLYANCRGIYKNDMDSLAEYASAELCDFAPVISEAYINRYGLGSIDGKTISDERIKGQFSNYSKELGVVFDAAAIGQFVGGNGIVKNEKGVSGYINETCFYNISKVSLNWEKENSLYCLYLNDGEAVYKIVNLHIHSKELHRYRSDRKEELVCN